MSSIFDRYAQDFARGCRGIDSPATFFARYAGQLGDRAQHQPAIGEVRYRDCDCARDDRR